MHFQRNKSLKSLLSCEKIKLRPSLCHLSEVDISVLKFLVDLAKDCTSYADGHNIC